jgi:hypothetical protein
MKSCPDLENSSIDTRILLKWIRLRLNGHLGSAEPVWIPLTAYYEFCNESFIYLKEEVITDVQSNDKLLNNKFTPWNLLGREYFRKEAEGVGLDFGNVVWTQSIQNYHFACGSVWVWNFVSDVKGGT